MKIAFLIPGIDAMGQNIFVWNLIQGLISLSNIECFVFHFDRGKVDTPILDFHVPTTKLKLFQKYDFNTFDIIFSGMPIPDLYVAIHGLYKTHKCVTFMHCFIETDLYQRKGKIKGFIEYLLWKYALNKFGNIICSSSAMQKYYENILSGAKKYKILPYGIPEINAANPDTNIVNKILKFKGNKNALCGCGTLIKRKGFAHLVQYLAHNEKSVVVLIGEGCCKSELELLATQIGVKDRILFLGYLQNPYKYFPYLDVFCMSSNSEGFGLAMLEAMCIGMPIVCSNLDIYNDYFGEDGVGLFKFGNQNSFNAAVDKVINAKEEFAIKSRNIFNSKFSLQQMCKLHFDYYNSLLGNNS